MKLIYDHALIPKSKTPEIGKSNQKLKISRAGNDKVLLNTSRNENSLSMAIKATRRIGSINKKRAKSFKSKGRFNILIS